MSPTRKTLDDKDVMCRYKSIGEGKSENESSKHRTYQVVQTQLSLSVKNPPFFLHDKGKGVLGGIKLEHAEIQGQSLRIGGWCLGFSEVELLCNGSEAPVNVRRIARPDVLMLATAANDFDPGFEIVAAYQPEGTYQLRWKVLTGSSSINVDFLLDRIEKLDKAVELNEMDIGSSGRDKPLIEIQTTKFPFVDGISANSPESGFIGNLDLYGPSNFCGWVISKKSSCRRHAISVYLGDTVIAASTPTIERPDVHNATGRLGPHGFSVDLTIGACGRAVAQLLARSHGDTSKPFRLRCLVGWSDDGNSIAGPEACEFDLGEGFSAVRSLADWLAYFGISFDPELFARRLPVYERIAAQVWETPVGQHLALPELYLTSLTVRNNDASKTFRMTREELVARFFDADYYVRRYGGDDGVRRNPLRHYLTIGATADFDPHPLFSNTHFRLALWKNCRSKPINDDPFAHFLTFHSYVNVDPHPTFSMDWYKNKYSLPIEKNPWVDYIEGGWHFGREPNWAFLQDMVWETVGKLTTAAQKSPLEIYLESDACASLAPHPLLPEHWKRERYLTYFDSPLTTAINTPLFDESMYRRQLGAAYEVTSSPYCHYFLNGEVEGIRPNVMFSPSWYRRSYGWTSDLVGPLVRYLREGERLGQNPSPLLNTREYIEGNNDVALAGVGALYHFLLRHAKEPKRRPTKRFDRDWFNSKAPTGMGNILSFLRSEILKPISPHPALKISNRARHDDIVELLQADSSDARPMPVGIELVFAVCDPKEKLTRGAAMQLIDDFEEEDSKAEIQQMRYLRMPENITRLYELFDERRSEHILAESRTSLKPEPLVSVIIPVRNRSAVILRAIESVLAQTYRNLEIVVVDDGSTDGTGIVARGTGDPRVRVIVISPSGVSAARNVGLREAKGEYVAYLDSDNTWERAYLTTVVGTMADKGHLLAHAALRVFTASGVIRYRGEVYDRDAMDRENYIDMNVFVHHRSVIEAGMQFDETLKRCVDWDFIRRACLKFGRSEYIPVVGCNYLDDDGKLERITTSELQGDFFRLCIKQINLDPHVTGRPREKPVSYSLIWPIERSEESLVVPQIWDAARHLGSSNHELIVVANGLSNETTSRLAAMSRRIVGMRVIHLWRSFLFTPAVMLASRIVSGERLLLWSGHVRYDSSAIDAFMLEDQAARAPVEFPKLVDEKGCLQRGLVTVSEDGSALIDIFDGQRIPRGIKRISGVSNYRFPVSISREHFSTLGGFDMNLILRFGVVEFALRTLMLDSTSVQLRADCPMQFARTPADPGKDKDIEKETSWFNRRIRLPTGVVPKVIDNDDFRLTKPRRRIRIANEAVTAAPVQVPLISTRTRQGGMRIQIRCPAPDDDSTKFWGDWHYAKSLAEGFQLHGQTPSICLKPHWTKPVDGVDVVIHIRGIVEIVPVPNAINVIWLISHPDRISRREIDEVDMVISASAGTARLLRERFGISSPILLQATDARRFNFLDHAAYPQYGHRLLFVGNSRKQPRRIVLDAIQNGLPLDVFGREWEYYLPPSSVRGPYLPNEELAQFYRSAAAVLNDHWPTMARYGIVSNRLFDVVAAGGVAISDDVEGINALFEGHVRTCRDAKGLSELANSLQDWIPDMKRRRDMSRRLLQEHSFEMRAQQILNLVHEI